MRSASGWVAAGLCGSPTPRSRLCGSLGTGLFLAALALLGGLAGLSLVEPAAAQGLLIVQGNVEPVPLPRPIFVPSPEPPRMTYKIKELAVQARIVDQIARVQVSQSFVNTGSRQMEVSFLFPLPYDGAIDRLTFMVDGKEYEAKLLPATEARRIYEGYVRRNQDPALLEWMGTGLFQTSVFPVPPGAERTVTLRFSQLLRKDRQLTDFLFPLSTAKYTSHPVEQVRIEASIETAGKLKSVYSPTHSIEVARSDDHHATVKFLAKNQVPTNDFRLFHDVADGSVGASVISYRPDARDDGYFLLLTSPEIKAADAQRPAKTVVLAVDRSGSMSGKKIEQAREALKFVVGNLREGDLFNIVAYDNAVETFRPELQRYSEETRKAAIGFIEGIYAGGSTNIEGALSAALNLIQDPARPGFVVFLTDGLPTAGETNEGKIVASVLKKNAARARVISFGVGYDVNSRLLDRLSHDNFGQSEYVRPDENIEAHVSRLYAKISSPVLTDVQVAFDFDEVKVEEGSPINRRYPKAVRDLFEGEQLVLVGRYRKPGAAKVVVSGRIGAEERKYDFPAQLTAESGDESYAFVEKLWATRRIGEIIDEIDLSGKNEELINELVALSTKHGIITPYTSFLADENSAPAGLADAGFGVNRAREMLERLKETEGRSAFAQRAEKKLFKDADRLLPPASDAAASSAPADDAKGEGEKQNGKPAAKTPPLPTGGVVYRDLESDKLKVAEGVRSAGNETLYKRGKVWIATSAKEIDPEKDQDKIKVVERFSKDYFDLVAANSVSENAVLSRQAVGEELLIQLRGQAYLIK